jgi:hypothetical protein
LNWPPNPSKYLRSCITSIALLTPHHYRKREENGPQEAPNQQVAAKIEKGSPVTAPGVPKNYPDAKKLVTEDGIQPGATK